jgi:hypothetical protein
MAEPQSVAQAKAEVDKARAVAQEAKAASDTALAAYGEITKKKNTAYEVYKASGLGTDSAEYKEYQALRSQYNEAKDASLNAMAASDNATQELARAQDSLTAAQKLTDTAANQTAATANTNPPDDTARESQTKSADAKTTETPPTPITKSESNNLKQKEKETQPEAVVVGGAKSSTAGGGRGNYTGYNAADEVANKKKLELGNNKAVVKSEPIPNPLDAYASYTYGLTLFVLTKDDYNKMVDDPTNFTPKTALISSAGRYRDTRDPEFTDDFYFDNFKVTTVIGLNANARGSNAINMEFTIIEPYGMTLLDRLMHIATTKMAARNYIDFPYVLQLDFYGGDDQGNFKKLPEHKKCFPIKFVSFKIKASVKGSEYQIQAVPFNHGANLESIQALKTRLEVSAGTVKEFFDSVDSGNQVSKTTSDETRAKAEQLNQAGAGRGSATAAARDPRIIGSTPASETVGEKSFTAAYNAWNIATTKTNDSKYADQIQFVIDPNIANSKIVDPKKNTTKRAPDTNASKETKAGQSQSVSTLDTSKTVHSFEAGTTVNDIINAIIPNSEFFLKQVKDSSQQGKTPVESNTTSDATAQDQATTLKMWKIVPQIRLGEFDVERNVWGKLITFYIDTYEVYQQRDKRLPKSPPPQPVKRYDYFYSGKNNAVINFDIDFNALYFTASQVDRANTEKNSGPKAAPDSSNADAGDNNHKPKDIAPTANRPVGSSFQTGVGGANTRSETQNAQSAMQSIYTSAGGDMVSLKMQIIGDPHFIKQDDLFVGPGESRSKVANTTTNFVPGTQSLIMDQGELYCYVTFKTPKDFNDTTGMYDLNSTNRYSVSEFSGYYRIINVDSEFRGGKFTQTLNMVRQPEQDSPNTSASQTKSIDTQRNDKASKPVNPKVAASQPAKTEEALQPLAGEPGAVVDSKGVISYPGTDTDKEGSSKGDTAPKTEADTHQTTSDKKAAEVATTGQTVPINEATPKTGDPVIAPPDNSKAEARKAIADARGQLDMLVKSNDNLQSENSGLAADNTDLQKQVDALASQDQSKTETQLAIKQLTDRIDANKNTIKQNDKTIELNVKKAISVADAANESAKSAGIIVEGINYTAGKTSFSFT